MSLLHRHKKEQEKTSLIARTLAGTFFLLCLGVLLVISYISFSWATITVSPREVSDEYAFQVPIILPDSPFSQEEQVQGVAAEIRDIEVSKQELFPVAAQQKLEKPLKMSGSITLVNTTSKDQPLVATTRLQQPGGILFRTTSFVVVPAKKQVNVEVSADKEGSYSVTESHFLLLGLAPALQSNIYGISFVPKNNIQENPGILTQKDIDSAQGILHEKLEKLMQENIDSLMRTSQGKKIITLPHAEETTENNHKVGEKITEFTLTMKGAVHVLILDETQGYEFLLKKLKEKEMVGYSISQLNKEDITYQFDQEADKNLMIKATAKILKRLTSQQFTVNKKNFVNKSASEVSEILNRYPEVADVQVRFYPFWITRAPLLIDHIHILVKE